MGDHATPQNRVKWLRIRALLAGGLVLGIGTAATLAAWNDSEYATTTVSASRFGIVGNMNNTGFAEHATTPGPTLTFSPALGQMSPGSVGYTAVRIRTTTDATVGGSVVMSTPTAPTGALASALQYSVRVMPGTATCDAALFSNASAPVIVANNTPLTTAVPANTQALQAAGANTVSYCIALSLPTNAPSSVQGTSANVTWQFMGTSTQ